jgi:hypothetical protein
MSEKEKMADNILMSEDLPIDEIDRNATVEGDIKEFNTGKNGARAFAQRLNAAKVKWEKEYDEKLFRELSLTNPYNGELIADKQTLKEILTRVLGEQEELLVSQEEKSREIESLKELLCAVQDEQEANELRKDPVKGMFFDKFENDAKAIVKYSRENGKPLSLEAAFNALLLNNLSEVLNGERETSPARTMALIEENRMASMDALGGEVNENRIDYASMSDEEFERVLKKALNGELRK